MLKASHTEPKEEVAPLVSTKEPYRDPNVPRKIQQIRFGLQNPQEIVQSAVLNVYERTLYKMPERVPAAHGVLDRRLGISNKAAMCETCGQKLAECEGHFGYIKLELPVFHIGYFKNTVQTLQCICKECSRVLLDDKTRRMFLKKFRNPRLERVPREQLFRRVLDQCKRQRGCPHCGAFNGVVKKATGSLKIIHDKWHDKKNYDNLEQYRASFTEAIRHNDGIPQHWVRMADDLHPMRVLGLFERISDDDLDVLDIAGRPEDLIVTHVAVPPVAIRPSVEMDGASNEDDITMKLMQIIEVNNVLRHALETGLPISNLMENWDFLQVQAAMLINSDLPGVTSLQAPGRPLRGFVQRLKGKQGRFRGNLSGKRVDFSGRTVISPDPNLRIDQVCVPQHMATVLTFPERVTEHNLRKLRERVINGASTWPGANFVITADGARLWLRDERIRRKQAAELKVGDVVERHLEVGDVVLFNRQPSLHRISIMAFRAVVRPGRTLRFNECVCSPFNADFDGDEMNLHLPQTQEARAEAIQLMGSVNNLCTPKNGEVLIAATQDFLTAAFLLTHKDRFFSRAEFGQLCASMSDGTDAIDLPSPALIKPLELWTGKQLFNVMVRPNAHTRIFVTMEIPEREYIKGSEHMCANDGYVTFRNSELVCGRLGKKVLGGDKAGLFATLNNDYGPQVSGEVMVRLSKLSARAMGNMGFSIGIDDVEPKGRLATGKEAAVKDGYAKVKDYIAQYNKGALQLQPGMDMEATLESEVFGVLNGIREQAGKVCMQTLHWHNSPKIMSQCGSKGSAINIAQMAACVGQQSVGGKRIGNGFKGRSLPHFTRGDKTPEGRGFVANSFYSGLTPTEFFFHTMGGREGLVDTAVKTAETGYMSRRLMKALEDLYSHYDATVRNAAGGIVQFEYGDDGMDPVLMESSDGGPIDLERQLAKVRASTYWERTPEGGLVPALPPSLLRERIQQALSRPELHIPTKHVSQEAGPGMSTKQQVSKGKAADTKQKGVKEEAAQQDWDVEDPGPGGRDKCSAAFSQCLADFLQLVADRYGAARARLGLPSDGPEPASMDAGEPASNEVLEYVSGLEGLTQLQLDTFVERCLAKYSAKRIDSGSTVGAIGAQSIGEPGTQMTLKTFHFAGVASMNVTLGVPRIKEIINGSKNISTPIMTVPLDAAHRLSEEDARRVKACIERTTLGQVAASMHIVYSPANNARGDKARTYIRIVLDHAAIAAQCLQMDAHTVKDAILRTPKLKLKADGVRTPERDVIEVQPPPHSNSRSDKKEVELLFQLEALLLALPKVIVVGIKTAERVVINPKKDGTHELLVEGTDLRAVMGIKGVLGSEVTTNHIYEVEKTLGIEAARNRIMHEIKVVMGHYGMVIDNRHIMLLADCMSYKGEVLGITRFGIAKMKDSVLHTASFERTADHLFDAAIHGRVDDVVGVSESIIMGIPMPVGTGLFKVLHNVGHAKGLEERPPPVLAYADSA